MIIFDTSYLVVLLHPNPPPAKDRENKEVSLFRERVAYLASTMDVSNEVIGVPAPAMAEILVRAGNARAQYVSILSKTWKFQILPFDSRGAIEASELIAKIKSSGEPWETWAKVKFDIQIVAIAKAESAVLIYADDRDIENYAKRLKIPVIRICDLPLPPPPEIPKTPQEDEIGQFELDLNKREAPKVEQLELESVRQAPPETAKPEEKTTIQPDEKEKG